MRALVRRSLERVEAECKVPAAGMVRFNSAVGELTRQPMNRARLERVILEYGGWTRALGSLWRMRELDEKLALCDQYARDVQAWYTVHSAPAAYGKDMWVDWTVRNDTDRAIVVNQGGTLWARGTYPAYRGEWDRDKQAWRYYWGGSSADPQVLVAPGRQESTCVGIGPGYLPMRPDGTITRVRPDLLVFPGLASAARVLSARCRPEPRVTDGPRPAYRLSGRRPSPAPPWSSRSGP